jgi:hypothetical protein
MCVSPAHLIQMFMGCIKKKSLKVWHRRRVYTEIFSVIFGPLYSHLPRLSYAIGRPTFTNGKSQRERREKSLAVHNALTAYRVDLYKHPKIVKNTLLKKKTHEIIIIFYTPLLYLPPDKTFKKSTSFPLQNFNFANDISWYDECK